jgi:hypothetical protein
MPTQRRPLKNLQLLLGAIFILSAAVFLVSSYLIQNPPGNTPSHTPDQGLQLVEYLSLLSSAVSLIALIPTTILGWRRDKRATTKAELDLQRREIQLAQERLELEQEKLELERLKASLDRPDE